MPSVTKLNEFKIAGNAKNAAVASLTDSSGGTASNTLAAIIAGAAYAQADLVALKDAVASFAVKIEAILDVLRAEGLLDS